MELSVPIFTLKRDAKVLARKENIPLHAALDAIAQREGFARWSLLAHQHAQEGPTDRILAQCQPGDLVLLAARPGLGKTMLLIDLIAKRVSSGGYGAFFSLDFTDDDVNERLRTMGHAPEALGARFICDTSDDICAERIVARMAAASEGTIVGVDYLQLLDQRRATAPLAEQLQTLAAFARRSGAIVICLSQISRAFDRAARDFPELEDVRLPNPADLSLFTRHIFLSDAGLRSEAA